MPLRFFREACFAIKFYRNLATEAKKEKKVEWLHQLVLLLWLCWLKDFKSTVSNILFKADF